VGHVDCGLGRSRSVEEAVAAVIASINIPRATCSGPMTHNKCAPVKNDHPSIRAHDTIYTLYSCVYRWCGSLITGARLFLIFSNLAVTVWPAAAFAITVSVYIYTQLAHDRKLFVKNLSFDCYGEWITRGVVVVLYYYTRAVVERQLRLRFPHRSMGYLREKPYTYTAPLFLSVRYRFVYLFIVFFLVPIYLRYSDIIRYSFYCSFVVIKYYVPKTIEWLFP